MHIVLFFFPYHEYILKGAKTQKCLSQEYFLRTPLSWAIKQRAVLIPYRRFGANHRSSLQGSWIFIPKHGTDWVVPKRRYKELPQHAGVIVQKSPVLVYFVTVAWNHAIINFALASDAGKGSSGCSRCMRHLKVVSVTMRDQRNMKNCCGSDCFRHCSHCVQHYHNRPDFVGWASDYSKRVRSRAKHQTLMCRLPFYRPFISFAQFINFNW